MGFLALVAGACMIAAGLWSRGKDHSWLLSLHGLALGAFGVIAVFPLVRGPLSFRPVSLLFTVMAASIGAFALATAQAQRRGGRGRWFLIGAGAASISFGFSFIAVGFFFRLVPPQMFFIWMSSYFVLCAVFMLWLAFRVYSRATGQSDQAEPLSPLQPTPRALNWSGASTHHDQQNTRPKNGVFGNWHLWFRSTPQLSGNPYTLQSSYGVS
jgi:uncharacterized membrane protein HdeD (DUF308 family)